MNAGEYPDNWQQIATRIKDAVDWKCELRANAVRPVESDMASAAKGQQIGKGVCGGMFSEAEVTKRSDMCNRQFFGEFVAVGSAMLAPVAVAASCAIPLLSPAWPVVWILAALPMWAFVCAKLFGKPPKPTSVSTESLSSFADPHFSGLATGFATVCYSPFLTFFGAVNTSHDMRSGAGKGCSARYTPLGRLIHERSVATPPRTIHLLRIASAGNDFPATRRAFSGYHLDKDKAK